MDFNLARKLIEQNISPRRKKAIDEKRKVDKCIMTGCECAKYSRGLCRPHLREFYALQKKLKTSAERLEFENNAINEGLILPAYEPNFAASSFAAALPSCAT